jgi:hypothetical protein
MDWFIHKDIQLQFVNTLYSFGLWIIYWKLLYIVKPSYFNTETKYKNYKFVMNYVTYIKILRNIISWTHNVLFFIFWCIYYYKQDNQSLNILSLSSIGYYIFDFLYIIVNEKMNISNKLYVYHHIVAYLMLLYNQVNPAKYVLILYMNEISNILLYPCYHLLKLNEPFHKIKSEVWTNINNKDLEVNKRMELIHYVKKVGKQEKILKLMTSIWYAIFRIGWNGYFFINTTLDNLVDYLLTGLMFVSFVWSFMILKGTFTKPRKVIHKKIE